MRYLVIFISMCGTSVEKNHRFCSKCGTKIASSTVEQKAARTPVSFEKFKVEKEKERASHFRPG